MAEMGHPVLVDPQYARNYKAPISSPRPLLHAYGLEFEYKGEKINLRAPLPEDFVIAMGDLKMRKGIF